jgi:hypothetical protein
LAGIHLLRLTVGNGEEEGEVTVDKDMEMESGGQ